MTKKHWTLTVWLRIQEPRIISVLQFGVYLAALGAGVSAFLDPPRSIEGAMGPVLTLLWTAMLLGGGLLGAIGVLPGIWWIERPAVILCFGAALIYGLTIFGLNSSQPGNRLVQVLMVAIVALYFASRWFRIRRYAYDPEK